LYNIKFPVSVGGICIIIACTFNPWSSVPRKSPEGLYIGLISSPLGSIIIIGTGFGVSSRCKDTNFYYQRVLAVDLSLFPKEKSGQAIPKG